MTSPDLTPPSPIPAIGVDDVARVEQWAARQRADLSRLSLAARSAQLKADKAQQAQRDAPPEVEAPEELLSVFDSMLETAVQAADLAVEAARREAAAIVAAEHERATDHLRSVGLDPLVALGPAGWTPSAIPDVARPASAGALWQNVQVEARAAVPPVPVAEPPMPRSPDDIEASDDAAWVEACWADGEDNNNSIGEAELFDDAAWFEACWGGGGSSHPLREAEPAGPRRAPMSESADDPEWMVDDAELLEVFRDDAERRRAIREMVPAGLGRPPPDCWAEPTAPGVEPLSAFPSRWPDRELAARELPGPTGGHDGDTSTRSKAESAEPFDAFWRGPELFDVFWSDTEGRHPIRDRLRRRATQEQR